MKNFLTRILLFFVWTVGLTVMLVVSSIHYYRSNFEYTIPKGKNILVVGDSRPEHAINDDLVPNAFNLAQSGSAYFYSYIKTREVIDRNPQIDTVIIGYSYESLNEDKDFGFDGDAQIEGKMKKYFFLFSIKDYLELLKGNPTQVLAMTPQVITYNFKQLVLNYSGVGGYHYSTRDKLLEAIIRFKKSQSSADNSLEYRYSTYQKRYLTEIYNYCQDKNKKVILLNVPLHSVARKSKEKFQPYFNDFVNEKIPDALVINHADFEIPDNGWADLGHLNHIGATIYSKYLKKVLENTETSSISKKFDIK